MLFEFLKLEGAQAELSWITIFRKREAYRAAFAGFDPAQVARFEQENIEALPFLKGTEGDTYKI